MNDGEQSGAGRKPEAQRQRSIYWVLSTYFAQGFPYTVVTVLSSLFFTNINAKESIIGLLNSLGLPWNFKFLWAPFVEVFATKRSWMIWLQGLITLNLLGLALLCFLAGSAADTLPYLWIIVVLLVVLGFLAATNDIAIDGYYMEGLQSEADRAGYSGYRVLAYRIAMTYARGGIVALVAYAATLLGTDSYYLPWCSGFLACAVTMAALSFYHFFQLPNVEPPRKKLASALEALHSYRRAFASYLDQDRVALILLFIVFYKMGDGVMFSMNTPFLRRELGVSNYQYAWLSAVVGFVGTISGAMLGGWWIKRVGLAKAIWPLTLTMNLAIWLYIALAFIKPDPDTLGGISTISAVCLIEQFSAGLGSAALLVFLLGTCKPDFKAAHYAIGSAIMSVPATFLGSFSGFIVNAIGYTGLFSAAFVVALPSFVLLRALSLGKPLAESPDRTGI